MVQPTLSTTIEPISEGRRQRIHRERTKFRFIPTGDMLASLQTEFEMNAYPDGKTIERLAEEANRAGYPHTVTSENINVWFKQKREIMVKEGKKDQIKGTPVRRRLDEGKRNKVLELIRGKTKKQCYRDSGRLAEISELTKNEVYSIVANFFRKSRSGHFIKRTEKNNTPILNPPNETVDYEDDMEIDEDPDNFHEGDAGNMNTDYENANGEFEMGIDEDENFMGGNPQQIGPEPAEPGAGPVLAEMKVEPTINIQRASGQGQSELIKHEPAPEQGQLGSLQVKSEPSAPPVEHQRAPASIGAALLLEAVAKLAHDCNASDLDDKATEMAGQNRDLEIPIEKVTMTFGSILAYFKLDCNLNGGEAWGREITVKRYLKYLEIAVEDLGSMSFVLEALRKESERLRDSKQKCSVQMMRLHIEWLMEVVSSS